MNNIKASFKVAAQVSGAVMVPTPEELSDAIRDTLLFDYGFDDAAVYDVTLEVTDEVIYDVKVRCGDEN